MRITNTQSLNVQNVAGATILIPCIPDTDIEQILRNIGVDQQVMASRVANDFGNSSDDALVFFANDVRIELIRVKKATFAKMRKAVHTFFARNGKNKPDVLHFYLSHLGNETGLVEAAVNGLVIGTYQPGLYKSGKESSADLDLHVYADQAVHEAITRGQHTAETQKEILGLVNAPANRKSPQTLADWAKASAEKYNYQVTVLEEAALKEQGFDALLAVNRGSEYPARFIICDYNPGVEGPVVALVGKGVTFDTGGLSIKPSNHMHYMKSDMGGAAAVLGTLELVAKQKLPVRVVGFVPATDNSVDARAIKPGDVIGSYSGQTIEVINTDAEGRLILADALAYAIKNYTPDIIIDLATLTGSVIRALGTHCAGLFSHDDDLVSALVSAGDSVGERLWRLPMWEDYAEDMRSDIADIKNLGDKPMAGSITAAKFLEHFTSEHSSWAHIDIAGTAFMANGVSRNHTATAYGVRLLFEWLSTTVAQTTQA